MPATPGGGGRVVHLVLRRGDLRPRGRVADHTVVIAQPPGDEPATATVAVVRPATCAAPAGAARRPPSPPRSRSVGRSRCRRASGSPCASATSWPHRWPPRSSRWTVRAMAVEHRVTGAARGGRRAVRQLRRPDLALRLGDHDPRRPRAGRAVQPVPEPRHRRRDVHDRGRAPRAAALAGVPGARPQRGRHRPRRRRDPQRAGGGHVPGPQRAGGGRAGRAVRRQPRLRGADARPGRTGGGRPVGVRRRGGVRTQPRGPAAGGDGEGAAETTTTTAPATTTTTAAASVQPTATERIVVYNPSDERAEVDGRAAADARQRRGRRPAPPPFRLTVGPGRLRGRRLRRPAPGRAGQRPRHGRALDQRRQPVVAERVTVDSGPAGGVPPGASRPGEITASPGPPRRRAVGARRHWRTRRATA